MKSPDRAKVTPPRHDEWEVLCALLDSGQLLEIYEETGSVTRAVLSAGINPRARPVSRGVAISLLSRGWLAKHSHQRGVHAVRLSRYRLSLRGWYAIRRTNPSITGKLSPGSRRPQPTSKLPPGP